MILLKQKVIKINNLFKFYLYLINKKGGGMEKSKEDLGAGFLVLLIGAATVIGSFNYSIGSLSRMGPGYFSLMAGFILIFLSLFIILKGARQYYKEKERGEHERVFCFNKIDKIRLKVWLLISLAMLAFVFLSIYVGFIVASFSIVFISALADKNNSIKSILTLSLSLTAFAVLVFYYLLKIQIPLWLL